MPSVKNKEWILTVVRENHQLTYRRKSVRIIAYFSKKFLKTRKSWINVFQPLKEITANLHYYIKVILPNQMRS
jgi:hypothetical protein